MSLQEEEAEESNRFFRSEVPINKNVERLLDNLTTLACCNPYHQASKNDDDLDTTIDPYETYAISLQTSQKQAKEKENNTNKTNL